MEARLHSKNFDKLRPKADLLLILGDGRCLKEDLDAFMPWQIPHDVGAIGRSTKAYPGTVHHWFNADGDGAKHWAENLPNGNGAIRHTLGEFEGFDCDWEIVQPDYHNSLITNEAGPRLHGSSSLFATLAALSMGYERVVLAGCPLDTEGHWYYGEQLYKTQPREVYGPVWLGYDFMAWLDFIQQPESLRVRSMSGYTKKILGEATKEWLTM